MKELTKVEVEGLIKFNKEAVAIFFYTPFCGTCKLATKMIDITLEALPAVNIYKCNVNSVPQIISKWEITSVPCIVILNKGDVIKRVYAINSVAKLYDLFRPLQK
jgi:thiol-disulfide isomerase/thioredoxin